MVLSIEEKSQIQALDRTQPGQPLKKGRCGTMTHDYKRNGTTTLFAALNVLDGRVIGRCMQQHRHQEFIRFLNAIEAKVPAGKLSHAIAENNDSPKPFQWTKQPKAIIAAVKRGHQTLDSIHQGLGRTTKPLAAWSIGRVLGCRCSRRWHG